MLIQCAVVLLTIVVVLWIFIRLARRSRRKNAIGIFHLYCLSGGGGERVLWHTVRLLLDKYPKYTIYIYTHKHVHHDTLKILLKARDLFKIDLISDGQALERLDFVALRSASLVEARHYPFLTLLTQSLMSIIVSLEAAFRLVPDIYMETIGFTFTLPVFKLLGSTVITYVHYPIISSDMIQNVRTSSHASFNNREIFVRSRGLRSLKLTYYKILAHLYGFAGQSADLVMVNSSWTKNHIVSLWKTQVHVVYPPCDVESFRALPLDRFSNRKSSGGALNIISIAQFRPEKNHQLQIEAFDLFLSKTRAYGSQLTLFGGCRDEEDKKRVDYLRDLTHRLDLASKIHIVVNAPFASLVAAARGADVAIHTMANEHFGIVLLEFMAAGLITVAHDSGGPRADIIDNGKNGYLAKGVDAFAQKLTHISKMSAKERRSIRENAVKKSSKFSEQVFERSLLQLTRRFLVHNDDSVH